MDVTEEALVFECRGVALFGVLHRPAAPPVLGRGVVIVVGGPQYRAGSHRQFVLLARQLAAAGFPVMRFDYRGMGDSEGDDPGFEHLRPDIAAAVEALASRVDGVQEVVLWGLCDAASAAMIFAAQVPRIAGIALANPWARSATGEARAYLRHYYLARVFSREFWGKLAQGELEAGAALRSFLAFAGRLLPGRRAKGTDAANASFQQRMRDGLAEFDGPVLLFLSGQDLTAKEFLDLAGGSPVWSRLLAAARVQRCDLPDATHTFSNAAWRDQVAQQTCEWLESW